MLDCIQLTAPSYERIAYATALRLGYPDSGRADNMIAGEVRCSYETAMTIGKPKYCCNVSPIKSCGGEIIELAGFVIRSSKWAHAALRLHNPSTACCFALTLGAAVDERIETMQDENFLKRLFSMRSAPRLLKNMPTRPSVPLRGECRMMLSRPRPDSAPDTVIGGFWTDRGRFFRFLIRNPSELQ